MAENQSINQDEAYWRRVVLSWVKCAHLNTGNDSIDFAACYNNFRCKIKDYHDLREKTIVEFLRVKFPDFELQFSKENRLPECDSIYVFSLMLYFSCVRHSIPYFQNICQKLDNAYQHSIKAFLNSFVSENDDKIVINRAFMNKAFQNAKRSATVLSEASCNRRDHTQHSVQMLTSTPTGKQEMKKPSPPTPKSVVLEWKVKNLNAMLESARTENINQERQIEQLLQNVKELQDEKKKYRSKISALQLKETCSCTSNSADLSNPTNRMTEQLQKQLEMNKTIIEELQEEMSKLKENTNTAMERYMAMKKQYAAVQEDNLRLKMSAEDLKEEIILRDNINKNLTETVYDLRHFIRENHIPGAELMEPLESSFEYLDKSFKNMTSDDSQCYDSENLASTVVDIKLKEKEHENVALTKKIHELEGKLEDMHKLQKEMLEQQQAEATAKISELLRSLAESGENEKQLTHDLDKRKTEIENLFCEFESQKQSQLEERQRLQAETNEKITELQRRLDEAVEGKMHLSNDFKKEQATTQNLNRELDEKNKRIAALRLAVADLEKSLSQITDNLGKGKDQIEVLTGQLESQKKLQLEEHARLQAEMIEKTTELQRCLDMAEESKRNLADEFKKEQAKTQDLNRELDIQQNLQADHNKKIAELRQALADFEKSHSQIKDNLGKGKDQIENLTGQLESQKKLQIEEHARLQAEMIEKTTELQRCLDMAEESKRNLADELKKEQAKTQDLNRELDIQQNLQADHDKKIAELRQALADFEKSHSQIKDNLGKGKDQIEDLTGQLESQKKLQLEELARLQAEMIEKTTELQRCLDMAEENKRNLADELKKEQAKTQDLNRELDIQRNLQADMNEKTAALRQTLVEAEKGKLQLQGDLQQSISKIEDLTGQLESQKKLQLEVNQRLHVEKKEKTAEMQQALADAVKDKSQRTEMLAKVSVLQQSLEQEKEKSEEINCQYMQMKKQADDLDVQCTKLMQKLSEDRVDICKLQNELASKDAKLKELNAMYEEKQKQFEKSYQDNEILSVKLYKARSALKEKEDAWTKSTQDARKAMEEKLRDARVEFDSTMEKMKERMKELHKEVKTKLECDNQGLALTADGYRTKVENLEVRCTKLQKQLAEMNERNLEVRKENQHLYIKLKTLEEYGNDRKSLMLPTQASLRSNLRMEDEEGELFNNMYLADLKSGRCVSPGPTNGGVDRYSELSQRNSKLLPHLRTNYVALAPDCEPPHDDTRDNMSTTFDDSSTGLISRRKVSGITSYKRPGPPTPSKRAGRLSLNGALAGNTGEIQYKDALRDANTNPATDGAGSSVDLTGSTRAGRTKTPGKFKQMISSSSLLNNFQQGNISAMPKTATRRVQQWLTDNTQDMPSHGFTKRKRLQRKILFDSNRCLAYGSTHGHQDYAVVNDATSLPLCTILECSNPEEKSREQGNVHTNYTLVDMFKSNVPMALVTTTILAMTRTTATMTDVTTGTTTTPTLATTTPRVEPVTPLAANDYSFKQPYGSNRYNILRMQVQRREKRRQLYDETRKVTDKGISVPSAVSVGSSPVGVTAHHKDDNDMDSTSDITLYHSFTSDTDDNNNNKPMYAASTIPITYPTLVDLRCTASTPLLLILLAYFGFLAQILFCLEHLTTATAQLV